MHGTADLPQGNHATRVVLQEWKCFSIMQIVWHRFGCSQCAGDITLSDTFAVAKVDSHCMLVADKMPGHHMKTLSPAHKRCTFALGLYTSACCTAEGVQYSCCAEQQPVPNYRVGPTGTVHPLPHNTEAVGLLYGVLPHCGHSSCLYALDKVIYASWIVLDAPIKTPLLKARSLPEGCQKVASKLVQPEVLLAHMYTAALRIVAVVGGTFHL